MGEKGNFVEQTAGKYISQETTSMDKKIGHKADSISESKQNV